MQKLLMIAVVSGAVCNAAYADFQPLPSNVKDGGFVSTTEVIVTTAQAKEMRDDVDVVLQGRILQQSGDDKYLFEDEAGTITVEIDEKGWRGQTITPDDTVKLYGDVDRGILKTEIDVDYVEKQ